MSVEHFPHTVYTKLNWGDGSWEEQENLFADSVVESCAPDIGKAVLHWRYGQVMGFDEQTFTTRAKKNLTDYYVKITIHSKDPEDVAVDIDWYGVIVSDTRVLDGAVTESGARIPSGTQKMTALGLEYLLTRKIIDTSVVSDGADGTQTIKRAIAFNLGGGHDNSAMFHGNLLSGASGDDVVFANDLTATGSIPWTSFTILEYLLINQQPTDIDGNVLLEWQLDPSGNHDHLKWHKPMMKVQGRTLFEVLNMLIDRRRLSSWRVRIVDDIPSIYVFTFNKNDVTLPDDKVILSNAEQEAWDFDTDLLVGRPVIERDAAPVFAKVISRGERRGFCFTISNGTISLEKDWSTTQQTAYNAGGSTGADYAAADEPEKQTRNRAARAQDYLKRVYSYFRIPPAWPGTISGNTVFPTISDVLPWASEKYWIPGLKFEQFIPLKTDINYTDTIVAEDLSATTGDTLAKSKKEYRRPFVVINVNESGTARYEDIDRLVSHDFAISIRMQDDAPGIVVEVHNRQQHVIANDEFTAHDSADEADDAAELRWQTMLATVFVQGDQYAEQEWPDLPFPTTDDVAKILVIDVPNMRLDYVVPGTLTHLNTNGGLETTANGGYIHDDRSKLLQVARMAYEWYSQDRQSLEVVEHRLYGFDVGKLITTIGSGATLETINSVVTQTAYDLRAGTTTTRTQFGELDFARLL